MKLSKLVLYGAGTVIVAAVVGIFAAPKVAAAVRGALVEIVIPSKPYYKKMIVLNTFVSVGPDTGTWGVTNITLTNYDASPQLVFIFAPVFASGDGAGCRGAIIDGGSPQVQIYVQPQQTLVIPYPTPLVFPGVSGHTCIGAEAMTLLGVGGSVEMDVNGFVN
jgi:hypothetical protein